jgi:hypothetical protein
MEGARVASDPQVDEGKTCVPGDPSYPWVEKFFEHASKSRAKLASPNLSAAFLLRER